MDELNLLKPILGSKSLAPTVTSNHNVSTTGNHVYGFTVNDITYTVRTHNDRIYIIAANNTEVPLTTTFTIPDLPAGPTQPVNVLFESRTLTLTTSDDNSYFTDRFDPDAAGGADLDEYDKQVLAVCGTEENFERRRRAQELGQSKGGYSAVQIALAWVLHQPLPIVPVIGPRTPAEVRSCVEAAAIRLTDDERDWLDLGR